MISTDTMSDSDSEADFESADEDTEHDASDKSSISLTRTDLTENNNPEIDQSFKSNLKINSELEVSSSKDKHENTNTEQLPNESSTNMVLQQSKENENTTTEDKVSLNRNELHESSRVTLRLEKKLKDRNQQITKENSTDKDKSTLNGNSESTEDTVKSSSWGFGSWGTSILSTAASSVSTFTNQVSYGIGTVLETVESTLGTPSPEEMAGIISKEMKNDSSLKNTDNEKNENEKHIERETDKTKTSESTNLLTGVSSWTKAIENTGAKVLMGGLDTLELIGKKTIDILTEGDPGLRKKRAALNQNCTLSQVLREAKTKADEQSKSQAEDQEDTIHYSQRFDEYQGLVHLEALEMLSSQSQAEVQRLMSRLSSKDKLVESLDEIRIICQNIPPLDDTPDDEKQQNFDVVFLQHIHALDLPINTNKLMECQKRINDYLSQCLREQSEDRLTFAEEIYIEAINSLAEFTAKCIEQFHKIAELILVQQRKEPSAVNSAGYLTGLTTVLCVEICIVSARFNICLDTASQGCEDRASVADLITSVYLEASNSTTYIQDAYQLFIPLLQLSLLESSA